MDMMAMAYLFDLIAKNRRFDADFEPRPPSRTKLFARRLLSAFVGKERQGETCRDRDEHGPCHGGFK